MHILANLVKNLHLDEATKIRMYQDKTTLGEKFAVTLLKVIMFLTGLRVIGSIIFGHVSHIQTTISFLVFLLSFPCIILFKKFPRLKYAIILISMLIFEAISVYYAYWIHPRYAILFFFGSMIRFYYGFLEIVHSLIAGFMWIIIHAITWTVAGYYSSCIAYTKDNHIWYSFVATVLMHIIFYNHHYAMQVESTENKIMIEKKNLLITNLVQAIPEGILVIDYSCNQLLVNTSFTRLAGESIDLDYLPQMKHTNESIYSRLLDDVKEFIESEQNRVIFGTVKSRDLALEVTATKSYWETTPAVILTFRDVTGLIKLEKEVVESNATIEALRGVSHELKTPLNVIINKSKELLDKSSLNIEDDLNTTLSSAQYLLFCIKSIIDYSSIKFQTYVTMISRVNVSSVLSECINICSMYQGTNKSQIVMLLAPTIPDQIILDESRFKQIILLVLSKSIHLATSNRIELRVVEEAGKLKISLYFLCSGGIIQSSESDYANPSRYNNKMKVNSGLINSLANNIIREVTGQDIVLDYIPPDLFTFSFSFPYSHSDIRLDDEDVPDEGQRYYPWPPLTLSNSTGLQVLVVDDIPINLQIAKSILKGIKIECICALSGKEAIEFLKKNQISSPKVILMDCMMPEMDGWETSEQIIELYKGNELQYLPFIIGHSAFDSEKDISKCFEAGMDDFLPKPSITRDYYNKISKWLSEPLRLGKLNT